jgi:plastocyanin
LETGCHPYELTVNGRASTVDMPADRPLDVGLRRPAVHRRFRNGLLTGIAALGTACGSSGGTTTPTPPVVGTTVTITSNGVSPKNLQVSPGSQVTFVNNDSRNHEMTSDPHPEHTDCPAINQVGTDRPRADQADRQSQYRPHLRLSRPRRRSEHAMAGADHHSVIG